MGESTSESDSLLIGISPYEDTFCRLDGGIDHKQTIFNRLEEQ